MLEDALRIESAEREADGGGGGGGGVEAAAADSAADAGRWRPLEVRCTSGRRG